MAGLLDNRDDLDQYLYDLLYGTRTTGTGFNLGPVSASYAETRPAGEPWPGAPDQPTRLGNVALRANMGPMEAQLRGALQASPEGTTISPGLSLGYGPARLSADLDINQAGEARPRFGGSLNLPFFGGDLSVAGSITPEQMKTLSAGWRKQLGDRGELGIIGQYNQPIEGRPDWRIGIGGHYRF